MTSRDEVVESLKRQVSSLSFELVRVRRENDQELNKKDQLRDSIVLKRDQRYKKTETQLAGMRSERSTLKRALDSATFQLEAKTHQVQSLQQEVATLCNKLDAAAKKMKGLEAASTNRVRAKKRLVGRGRLKKCMKVIGCTTETRIPESTRPLSPPSADAARGTPLLNHSEGGAEVGNGECVGDGGSGGGGGGINGGG